MMYMHFQNTDQKIFDYSPSRQILPFGFAEQNSPVIARYTKLHISGTHQQC